MPLTYQYNDNIFCILGLDAQENQILIENSDPQDIWIHMNSVPSGHVVIKYKNFIKLSITDDKPIIEWAARICFNNISNKNQNKSIYNNKYFDVIVTFINNLIFRNEDNLHLEQGEVEFKSKSKKKLFTFKISL